MHRTRGFSVSSTESTSSSTSSIDSDHESTTSSIDLDSDGETDEERAQKLEHAERADDAAIRKIMALDEGAFA